MINKKEDIKECECNFCNSKFYYTNDDIINVNENYYGFICPECGNEIEIYKINDCKFPESFYFFGDGKRLSNNTTQIYINEIKHNLEESEDYDYCLMASGDTLVFGVKNEDGITIYVAKSYYEYNLYLN